jgi:hypothetical protein
MKEITGDLWDRHDAGSWIVVTTNGVIKRDGSCVMGRGIARQAKDRFPRLPFELGAKIEARGNVVFSFPQYRIYTLPTKHDWRERADLDLIVSGCHQLVEIVTTDQVVYLVRPGCGNGGLAWNIVQSAIAPVLDNRFVVIDREKGV